MKRNGMTLPAVIRVSCQFGLVCVLCWSLSWMSSISYADSQAQLDQSLIMQFDQLTRSNQYEHAFDLLSFEFRQTINFIELINDLEFVKRRFSHLAELQPLAMPPDIPLPGLNATALKESGARLYYYVCKADEEEIYFSFAVQHVYEGDRIQFFHIAIPRLGIFTTYE